MNDIKSLSRGHILANVAFLLADVLEMLMLESSEILKKENKGFKHEVKQRYNAARNALVLFRREFITKTPSTTQELFGRDADIMFNMIKLLVDRCSDDENMSKLFFNKISEYPSLIGLNIEDCYELLN